MWIINSELANKYEITSIITDGNMILEGIRIFPLDGMEITENIVYIGSASDYFNIGLDNSVILASMMDFIIIHCNDIIKVLNDILEIFDKYRIFAEKLKNASMTKKPFDNMLDIMHNLFKCPMLFGQKNLRIYSITEQYTDAEVYMGWSVVKELHTMPLELINSTVAPDMTRFSDAMQTVAIPVDEKEGKYFKYQIRSNIYVNMKLWGHLYLYYYNQEISKATIQLARYCADAYGEILEYIGDNDINSSQYTFLIDILDGRKIDEKQLDAVYWQTGIPKDAELVLYKIEFVKSDYLQTFFEYIFMTLNHVIRNKIIFSYQNCIIMIAQDNGKYEEPFLTLSRISDKNMLCCGSSYPFSDLKLINIAYHQATFVVNKLKRMKDTDIYFSRYDNYAFAGMIEYIRENFKYEAFVAPQLFKLYKMDKEKGTQYYKTLFWMLVNNCHSTEAAKQMYIHRNTLKYRMDRIMEIIKMDIYDSDVAAYLRFCYSLMLEDYPLEVEIE